MAKNKNTFNRALSERYGSRKGALLTFWCRLLHVFGRYRSYRRIDWSRVERIVFVCKGNICRSAFAEAVAKSKGIQSISCGISTVSGDPANEEAIRASAIRGYDLSEHQTTPIHTQSFRRGDLLIAMEPWQARYLLDQYPAEECSLLGLWGRPVSPYIHDPYGSTSGYFDKCFSYIENYVEGVAKKLDKRNADEKIHR